MSKRVLQINAYVLTLIPVGEINRKEGSSSMKAIGFLHQHKCRHAYVLSLTPLDETNIKRAAAVRKQWAFSTSRSVGFLQML